MRLKNARLNADFKNQHPDLDLPPPYMVYESFQINYAKYYVGGKEDAAWIISLVDAHIPEGPIRVLDWGCGPARILRHLPDLLGRENEYAGTDYNPDTVRWCQTHIPGISFSQNQSTPPLPFASGHFHLVYGISVLTHLSPANQSAWIDELFRVMAPGGILFLTTHGDAFLEKLTSTEALLYQAGHLITRDKTKEGHRTFGTFHPPSAMQQRYKASGFSIVQHIPGKRVHASYISQDDWILQKKVSL